MWHIAGISRTGRSVGMISLIFYLKYLKYFNIVMLLFEAIMDQALVDFSKRIALSQ